MDGSEQGCVKGRVGAAACQAARHEQGVEGQHEEISKDDTGRGGLTHFGRITAPPTEAFVQNNRRSKNGSERIKFAGGNQSDNGIEDQEKQSGAVEALGGQGRGEGGGRGGHVREEG